MKKFKKFFVSLAVVVVAVANQGCATVGGYGSLPAVVASNAALPYQILAAGQVGGWAPYPPYGYRSGNVVLPACRPQDIPPGMKPVSEPMPIKVEKGALHKWAHAGAVALGGGGLGTLVVGGARGAGGGSTAGGGLGGYLALDEHEYCLLLPAPKP